MMDFSYTEFDKLAEEFYVGDEFVFLGLHMYVDRVIIDDDNNVVLTCAIIEDREDLETAIITMPKKSRITTIKK